MAETNTRQKKKVWRHDGVNVASRRRGPPGSAQRQGDQFIIIRVGGVGSFRWGLVVVDDATRRNESACAWTLRASLNSGFGPWGGGRNFKRGARLTDGTSGTFLVGWRVSLWGGILSGVGGGIGVTSSPEAAAWQLSCGRRRRGGGRRARRTRTRSRRSRSRRRRSGSRRSRCGCGRPCG